MFIIPLLLSLVFYITTLLLIIVDYIFLKKHLLKKFKREAISCLDPMFVGVFFIGRGSEKNKNKLDKEGKRLFHKYKIFNLISLTVAIISALSFFFFFYIYGHFPKTIQSLIQKD